MCSKYMGYHLSKETFQFKTNSWKTYFEFENYNLYICFLKPVHVGYTKKATEARKLSKMSDEVA